jgi:hypothetical protein
LAVIDGQAAKASRAVAELAPVRRNRFVFLDSPTRASAVHGSRAITADPIPDNLLRAFTLTWAKFWRSAATQRADLRVLGSVAADLRPKRKVTRNADYCERA